MPKSVNHDEPGSGAAPWVPPLGPPPSALPPHRTPSHDLNRIHIWQIQAVRDVMMVAAVIFLIWLGYAMRAVTVPLLVALLLAYLFEPLIQWMCNHPKLQLTRVRAVTMLLITIVGSLLIVLAIVVPLVIGQTSSLISNVRDGTMHERLARIGEYLPDGAREDFDNFLELLPAPRQRTRTFIQDDLDALDAPPAADDAVDPEVDAAQPPSEQRVREIVEEELARLQAQPPKTEGTNWMFLARGGTEAIGRVLGSAIKIALLVFLIPFYFFFFALWYPSVLRFARTLIPDKNKERSLELLHKMDRVVSGFVRGRIVIAFLMGVMFAIGWYMCGVPYAITLGIVIGVFSLVPYLAGLGLPLSIGLLYFDQLALPPESRSVWLGWWGVFLWPTLVYLFVQAIESYILTPMIAGKATNLDPVTVMVAVLAGGTVGGVYGMLLAIPVAACLKILWTEIVMPRIQAWMRGELEDPLPISRE